MQNIKIKTPQNVFVGIKSAGVAWRILSFFIDIAIIITYCIAFNYVLSKILGIGFTDNIFSNTTHKEDYAEFIGILYFALYLPAIFYSLWTEYFFSGQTLGKLICGIRVVKLEGYKANFTEYFTRWIFRFVDIWTALFLSLFLIPIFGDEIGGVLVGMLFTFNGLYAIVSIVKNKNSQRLGDVVAGTTVVKLKEKQSISITILEELHEAYVPTYSQVIKLSDNDARIIKDTFKVAKKSKDYNTIKKLREKLEDVMQVTAQESDMEFIAIVMKDFNYFTQKL